MATKKKTEQAAPKVWPVQMIPTKLIHQDPKNTQKQDRATFAKLMENIEEQGFDEPIIVIPHPDLPGEYVVMGGNHRHGAAKKLGMEEIPAVIRTDWDHVQASLQSIRRNYARGKIDKAAFSKIINSLQNDFQIDLDDIQAGAGFSDEEDFAAMYEQEKAMAEEASSASTERTHNESAGKIKLLDDLGLILSYIAEEYGDTAVHSFIVFPAAGKKHMFVQANNALKTVVTKIAAACVEKGLDINTALAGLLQIGLANTSFISPSPDLNKVREAEALNTTDEDDTDFAKIEATHE